MAYHDEATGVDIHVVCRWEVADATARLALSVTEADEGKFCWQQDDNSIWILAGYSGPTWVQAGGGSQVHDPVTLSTDADGNLLDLTDQEIGLDDQSANLVFAGPSSGGAAAPAFRVLVDADIPSEIARDSEVTGEIGNHAGDADAHHTWPLTLNELPNAAKETAPTYVIPGSLSAGTGTIRLRIPWNIDIVKAYGNLDIAGSTDTIVDVHLNGVTIFATQGNRLTISSSQNSGESGSPDVNQASVGDYLTVDIDQAGTGAADLTVQILCRKR